MQPVRHAGLAFTRKAAHGFKIMDRQQARNDRCFDTCLRTLIAEGIEQIIIKEELRDGARGTRIAASAHANPPP